jgi:hypothetical protein
VIHRKLSLGTQSNNGERFAERALSVASPAACNAARCSPTSANYSPHTTAATRSPRSPEPRGLNGYLFSRSGGRRDVRPRVGCRCHVTSTHIRTHRLTTPCGYK